MTKLPTVLPMEVDGRRRMCRWEWRLAGVVRVICILGSGRVLAVASVGRGELVSQPVRVMRPAW